MSKINQILLRINRLGAIRNSQCHLNQFVVISGESGLGKSYLAATCNYIFHLLSSPTRLNNICKAHNIPFFNDLRAGWGNDGDAFSILKTDLESWISKDIPDYLRYLFNAQNLAADIDISLPIPDTLVFHYTKEVESIDNVQNEYFYLDINKSLRYKVKNEDESIQGEGNFAFLLRFFLINEFMGDFRSFDHNFILPPSRGAALTETIIPRSGLYTEFLNVVREINVSRPKDFTPSEKLVTQFNRVLDGTVSISNTADDYTYTTKDNTPMPLSAAASSVRELSPLFLFITKFDISKTAFFIEEPEAHLHPYKQRIMADILALMINNGSYVQITTHSDYLLRRLNELIEVNRLSRQNAESANEIYSRISAIVSLESSRINALLLVKSEKGEVGIVEQSLENGFDFSSFITALTDGLENERYLNELKDNTL